MSGGQWWPKCRILGHFFYCQTTSLRLFKQSKVIGLWISTGGTHSELWCNPWGQGQGMWPRRVQNLFCTNKVILHITSKVMKSRIQWCKHYAPEACLGVTRGQKIGFWVICFIVTRLLLGILSQNLETVTGYSPMDKDEERIWNFDVQGNMRWRWRGDMRWCAIDLL